MVVAACLSPTTRRKTRGDGPMALMTASWPDYVWALGAIIFGLYTLPVKRYSVYDGVVQLVLLQRRAPFQHDLLDCSPVRRLALLAGRRLHPWARPDVFPTGLRGSLWCISNLCTSGVIVKSSALAALCGHDGWQQQRRLLLFAIRSLRAAQGRKLRQRRGHAVFDRRNNLIHVFGAPEDARR